MKASKGEEKIIRLLQKSGYRFEREKRFKDLRHELLRFDFYVMGGPSKFCIIEVNGMQHYKQVANFITPAPSSKQLKRETDVKLVIVLQRNTNLFQPKFRAYDRWKNDKDYTNFLINEKFDKSMQNLIEYNRKRK